MVAPASGVKEHEPVVVKCGFCGHEFVEDPSQATCQACPIKQACGLMRCPACGYENPRPPKWIAALRKWMDR